MKISKEIIQAIVDSSPENPKIPLAKRIADELNRIKSIRASISEQETNIASIEKRAKEEIEQCRKNIKAAQKKCGHEVKTYHPDPSGNNDSYYECDICGAEL